MSKNKRKRPQKPKSIKVRNEDWMRARLDHSNRNNTVPSGNVYKRKGKYGGWE